MVRASSPLAETPKTAVRSMGSGEGTVVVVVHGEVTVDSLRTLAAMPPSTTPAPT